MRKMTTLAAVAALLMVGSVVQGQSQTYRARNLYRPVFSYPYFSYRASTATESYLRGAADVIRAQGDYNYNTSAAAINAEIARSKRIENYEKYVRTYFETKRINNEYREANRVRRDPERIIKTAANKLPARLNDAEYDRAAQQLQWPAVLKRADFELHREAVNKLMASRNAATAEVGDEAFQNIDFHVAGMQKVLKDNVSKMSFAEYSAANRFLKSLKLEIRTADQPAALAAK